MKALVTYQQLSAQWKVLALKQDEIQTESSQTTASLMTAITQFEILKAFVVAKNGL